jgi:hypothetical protein
MIILNCPFIYLPIYKLVVEDALPYVTESAGWAFNFV